MKVVSVKPDLDQPDEDIKTIAAGNGFRNGTIDYAYEIYLRGVRVSHPLGHRPAFSVDGCAGMLSDLTGVDREEVRRELLGATLKVDETYSYHAVERLSAVDLPMRLVVKRVR